MRRTSAMWTASAAGLAIGSTGALAQVGDWAAPVTGQWSTPANWAPAVVPNGAGFTANISVGGVYGVTLGAISPVVNVLNLSNAQATLGIDDSRSLTISTMTNNGVITVNSNSGFNVTSLIAGAPAVAFGGSGSLVLNAVGGVPARAQLTYTAPGNVVTNGGTHVIRGAGNLAARLVNNSTVRADLAGQDLLLSDQPKTNHATMRAEGTGRLRVSGITLTQSAAGTLFANGGTIRLDAGTVLDGGQFGAQAGSAFEFSGSNTLRNAAATLTLPANRSAGILDASALSLDGILVNNGTLTINSSGGFNVTQMTAIATNTRLNGNGTLVLNAVGDVPARALLGSSAATSILTNGANHTIRGAGSISAALTNLGTVTADVPGSRMQFSGLAKSNSGTVRAQNGALLDITGITLSQAGTGVVRADSGVVRLTGGATLAGGLIETLGTGAVEVSGTGTIEESTIAVVNAGTISVRDAATLTLRETITNNGNIAVNPDGGFNITNVSAPAGETATLSGSGSLTLSAVGNNPLRARVIAGAGGIVVNDAGHTIRGNGQIEAFTSNFGTISANIASNALVLTSEGKINEGLIRSISGGVLRVDTSLSQQPAGVLRSGEGRVELTSSALVSGGTLESGSGGTFEVTGNPARITDTFGPTLHTGTINVQDSRDLRLSGILDNDGTIVVNPAGGFNITRLSTGSPVVTLDGSGELVLNAVLNNPIRAQIFAASAGDVLIQESSHTIRGRGDISAALDNRGLVSADVSANFLDLSGGGKTNSGVLDARNGGILRVFTPLTQTPGGVLRADGGTVQLSGSPTSISGGALESLNGGVFEVIASGGDLSDAPAGPVSSSARVNILDARSIDVVGEFINNGTVVVNSQSGFNITTLRASSPAATLSGSGRVVLNAVGGVAVRAQLTRQTGSDTLVNGLGHTIEGTGNISVPLSNNGRLSPGSDLAAAGQIADLIGLSVPITFGDDAELDIQVSGVGVGQFDRLVNAADSVSVDGTLRIRHASPFTTAPFGTQLTVVQALSVSGTFDEVIGDPLPEPLVWRAIYTPTQVRALVSCKGDVSGDGTIDSGDLATFITLFLANDLGADITGDGQIDSGDLGVFISIFLSGC